jgi:hypothetical protein
MEKEPLKDDFLRTLLKTSQAEKPALDFAAKVMVGIQQAEAEKARNPLLRPINLLLLGGGVVLLGLLYYFLSPFIGEWSLTSSILDPTNIQNYVSFLLNSFKTLLSLIDFLRESSITLIVLLVIPSLVVFDRMLRRLSGKTFLFVF